MRISFAAGALAVAVASARMAGAQSGATLTPDMRTYLVSKDVGAERWTVSLTVLRTASQTVFGAVTGNVFNTSGAPPSFITCQVIEPGFLSSPGSRFLLRCRGTDPCPTTAVACAADAWRPIPGAEEVSVNTSFFLPDTEQQPGRATRSSEVNSPSGSSPAGATLSFERSSFLVSKDVGDERWSISVNREPNVSNGQLTYGDRISSITGNILRRSGGSPSFVYCVVREDSEGNLGDSASNFRLRCLGTDACVGSPSDCAQNGWREVNGDVVVPASFFLPPEGLPPPPQSDSELTVIGRTSGPPSLLTNQFTSKPAPLGAAMGGCRGSCLVNVGSCPNALGNLQLQADGSCKCLLDFPADGESIRCIEVREDELCGGDCFFNVGLATARGTSLRTSVIAGSGVAAKCACFARASEDSSLDLATPCFAVFGCPLICDAEDCGLPVCSDDPTDGCEPSEGDLYCPGVC